MDVCFTAYLTAHVAIWDIVLLIIGLNAFGLNQTDFYGHSDPDMLEVGNGLSHTQERSHFALWAAMKSPLLIGTNLEKISPSSLDILKSKTLVAFNQDPKFGKPAKPFKWDGIYHMKVPPQYWSGNFSGGTMALLLNIGGTQKAMGFSWEESPDFVKGKTYRLTDGWNSKDYGCFTGGVNVTNIAPYDTAVLVMTDDCSSSPAALEASSDLPKLTL
jgi:alpha-galactosidase